MSYSLKTYIELMHTINKFNKLINKNLIKNLLTFNS